MERPSIVTAKVLNMKMGDIEYPSLKGKVSETEWQTRLELAAVFRLIPVLGWWDPSQAPAAARIPGTAHYLFNPKGCLFEELTASSLVKIDINGDPVTDSPLTPLKANWFPFKALFSARTDVDWALHTHDDWVAALSARKERLQPVTQSGAIALALGVAYHEYDGVEIVEDRNPALQRSLGATGKRLILLNHGLLVAGNSAPEIVMTASTLSKACRGQVLAGALGECVPIQPAVVDTIVKDLFRPGGIDNIWPALLRKLDRMDPTWRD